MAIALPPFNSGEISFNGVRLPPFNSGEIDFNGVRLPVFATAEERPSVVNIMPSGGFTLGGAANIVGDPFIPTGGVIVAGAAVIEVVDVEIYTHYPLGGMSLSGMAMVTSEWVQHSPTGGFTLSGMAIASSTWTQHMPVGGITLGGTAASLANGGANLAEGAGFGDVVSVRAVYVVSLAEGLVMGDAAASAKRAQISIAEGIGLAEVLQPSIAHAVSVGEALAFSDAARVNEVLSAYVYNTVNTAVSTYKGYNFNSFALIGGKYYGADLDGGVYELVGVDDEGAPVDATITFPTDDLSLRAQNGIIGAGKLKRCEVAYLGYTANGDMFLRVDANGESKTYSISPNATPGLRTGRILLGKGVSSRYWDFTLGNLRGADFELESITFVPVVLGRNITEY